MILRWLHRWRKGEEGKTLLNPRLLDRRTELQCFILLKDIFLNLPCSIPKDGHFGIYHVPFLGVFFSLLLPDHFSYKYFLLRPHCFSFDSGPKLA